MLIELNTKMKTYLLYITLFYFLVQPNEGQINGGDPGWNPGNPLMLSAVPASTQSRPRTSVTQNTQPPQPSNTVGTPWKEPTMEKVVDIPEIMYKYPAKYNYAEALAKSMLFYEAQRSGRLPLNQRVKWRGDSAVNDGEDNNVDLSGGYYDGGGYVKYGFSQAHAITVLAWGLIRYRRTYEVSGQLQYALDTIRWGTDYFLKCHTADNEFYGQVSDKGNDQQYFGPPETMTYKRKSYKLDKNNPGSDVVAETAAALAASSIVFYHVDRDYSERLLQHAIALYDFAAIFKRPYHDSIKVAGAAYRSTGFKDELAWAAAWIYRRNGDQMFLREAKKYYLQAKLVFPATQFSWDDKRAGVQMLMAEITGGIKYKNSVSKFCNYVVPGGGAKYTPAGMLYQQEWGPLRYSANAAFICALAADLKLNSTVYRSFALSQIDYILGSTGRSYVVGFGVNPPQQVHHESSFCPSPPAECPRFAAGMKNNHILYGALIGGPDHIDDFYNDITNQKQSSVTLDYNAGYQSALAAILDIHIWGTDHADRPPVDKPGKISEPQGTDHKLLENADPNSINNENDEGDNEDDEEEFEIDYATILQKSLLFFAAQRSGEAPKPNRVPWRGNSALFDGQPEYSLSGGYYDGGMNYVKYSFPLAYSVTMLSWSLLENGKAYETSRQTMYLKGVIKWAVDYLRKCHLEASVFVAQVGDETLENEQWDRPEYLNQTSRRVFKLTPENPGSDVAAEAAAAMAAAAMVFKKSDRPYYYRLLNHSELLLKFASTNPTKVYTDSIPSAAAKYPSEDYFDEVAWACLWFYKATGQTSYLNRAKLVYNNYDVKLTPDTFSYDIKNAGVQVLLSQITENSDDVAAFCNNIIKNGVKTPKGLFYYTDDMPSRHAAGVAFIMLKAYKQFKNHTDAKKWRDFAKSQLSYLLGEKGRNYVVGYGFDYPRQPLHEASSCPTFPAPCGWTYAETPAPNPQILHGALVGGPDENDNFEGRRLNKKQSSVSLDTNAVFQSAIAALYELELEGDFKENHATFNRANLLTFIASLLTLMHLFMF